MVKFVLRKTRAVFPSLAVIITIITIMALKSNHLKDAAVNVSLVQKIQIGTGHYFLVLMAENLGWALLSCCT